MTTRKDVRRLIKQTRHKDASLRALAALELGEVGSKYPKRALGNVVPTLRKILNDSDSDVITSAREALGDIRSAYLEEQEKMKRMGGGKFKMK
ncbi:MAG: HEAT repeat domain-containing protein [Candidatus Helarchaeota archaeon]|nr:HEAT repeat domain-containing protein [Candidatus Helarchaeota archaeon]